jgi:ubiquitin-conjugating enzyme E2 variant
MSERQSFLVSVWKGAALAVALALVGLSAVRLAAGLSRPAHALLVLAGLLAGYLVADLVSGVVHWFCDSFFAESTPLIGALVIRPFREHHRQPQDITRFGFLEQDSTTYVLPIPLLWLALGWPPAGPGGFLAHAALVGFALGSMGTNLFHKWAHAGRVPPGVRWLQRHGLVLSPAAHGVHHRSYDGGYCVTSGWMNRLLDPLAFFPRLERLVRACIGRRRDERGPS